MYNTTRYYNVQYNMIQCGIIRYETAQNILHESSISCPRVAYCG